MHPEKLHLGCGLTTPEGWLNVDGSWNAWFAKHPSLLALLMALRIVPRSVGEIPWSRNVFIHDLAKPLPFPSGTFRAVYSSHTFEHLYLEETQRLLGDCYRVLAPGGVARIVVPDLKAQVQDYLGQRSVSWPDEPFVPRTAADRLNRNLCISPPARRGGSLPYRLYQSLTDRNSHKWMFDADSLAYHMRQAGFQDVGERQYLDSRIADIGDVEQSGRLLEGQGVAVEGVKPR
jgi:ubiquinone/menaquinone biosynthesis C-methylase UbiE